VKENVYMSRKMGVTGNAVLAIALVATFLGVACVSHAASAANVPAQGDSSVADGVMKKLDKKQFKNVKATVDGSGIVTLSGTVDLYEYKMDAEKRVHKTKGVMAVRNEIEVAGPDVPDSELKQKLAEKLTYDRVGYGNLFNAISVDVQNGVVTLGGHARTDVDKDSALALVSTHPGVKDVVDEIEVDPVSTLDDQTRLAVARAVYGTPSLQRYAVDPAKPIRISVQNGHVELSGAVDSQADKNLANIKANQVPGVFSVKNDLQVVGASSEKAK
jgi:hyperosmotically inducible periplasmic protein